MGIPLRPPARASLAAPVSPSAAGKAIQDAIDASEGIISAYGEGEPDRYLAVSLKAAKRFFALAPADEKATLSADSDAASAEAAPAPDSRVVGADKAPAMAKAPAAPNATDMGAASLNATAIPCTPAMTENADAPNKCHAAPAPSAAETPIASAYVITGFDLHEIISDVPMDLTVPATVDGKPVVGIVSLNSKLGSATRSGVIAARPMRAVLARLVLPHTMLYVGKGVLAGLLPHCICIPAQLEHMDLAGFAGSMAYLNSISSDPVGRPAAPPAAEAATPQASQIAKRSQRARLKSLLMGTAPSEEREPAGDGGSAASATEGDAQDAAQDAHPDVYKNLWGEDMREGSGETPQGRKKNANASLPVGLSMGYTTSKAQEIVEQSYFDSLKPLSAEELEQTPQIATRLYFDVEDGAVAFASIDGSLYTADLSRLLFLAMPYPAKVALPDGVQDIDQDAYVYGNGVPKSIIAPPTLRQAMFSPSSACLWVCEPDSKFRAFADSQGWMTASAGYVRSAAFDYDILPDGTARVIRCNQKSSKVEIPAQIDGRDVTSVGANAFGLGVRSISMPSTVKEIMGATVCPSLTALHLPAGLERIGPQAFRASRFDNALVIPKSVRSIGASSFEKGLITFEATGATVLADPPFAGVCFCEGIPPFDFARYDADLAEFTNRKIQLKAMLVRLASPYALSEIAKERFTATLVEHVGEVLAFLERTGDLNTLNLLMEADIFDEDGINRAMQRMNAAGQTECTIALMDHKHKKFGHAQGPARARFAL